MNKNNKEIEKAISIIRKGFKGSEEELVGQWSTWRRFFALIKNDKTSTALKGSIVDFAKEIKSNISDHLPSANTQIRDLIYEILIYWRNLYFIQRVVDGDELLEVRERIKNLNRKLKEIRDWLNHMPLWLSKDSKELIKLKAEEELREITDNLRINYFTTKDYSFDINNIQLIQPFDTEDWTINSTISVTYKLLEKYIDKSKIDEINEHLLESFGLQKSFKGHEVSPARRRKSEKSK